MLASFTLPGEIVQKMTYCNATKMLVDTSYIQRLKEVEGKLKFEVGAFCLFPCLEI